MYGETQGSVLRVAGEGCCDGHRYRHNTDEGTDEEAHRRHQSLGQAHRPRAKLTAGQPDGTIRRRDTVVLRQNFGGRPLQCHEPGPFRSRA